MPHSSHVTVMYSLSLMFSHMQDIFNVHVELWYLGIFSSGTQRGMQVPGNSIDKGHPFKSLFGH